MLRRAPTPAALMLLIAAIAGAQAQPATAVETAGPGDSARTRHATGPELQRAPGGRLIVNAFILDGPVRVEIRDRESDALLVEKEAPSLFPFEVSADELKIRPDQARVRIFVRGQLEHELELEPR